MLYLAKFLDNAAATSAYEVMGEDFYCSLPNLLNQRVPDDSAVAFE